MEKLVLKIAAKILNKPMDKLFLSRSPENGVVLWFRAGFLDGTPLCVWAGSGANEIQMLRNVRAHGAAMIGGW